MFLESWESLLRVVFVGVSTYVALVVLLRISGKRTLSKMNMFDFIVTIALGSIFATIIISKDVTVARGIVGAMTLILSQYVVTSLSTRFSWFQNLVKGEPSLLYYDNRFLTKNMRKERVTKEEVYQAMRKSGLLTMEQTHAVVLETDGSFTAIPDSKEPPESLQSSSLQNLPLDLVEEDSQ